MVDKDWLQENFPDAVMEKSNRRMEGIGGVVTLTTKATFNFLILGHAGKARCRITAWVAKDKLRPNLLVGNEWLVPHGAVLDFAGGTMTLQSCRDLTLPFTALRIPGTTVTRKVTSTFSTIVPPRSTMYLAAEYDSLPANDADGLRRDYVFLATDNSRAINHLLTADTAPMICVVNDDDTPLTIRRHQKLGTITDIMSDSISMVSWDTATAVCYSAKTTLSQQFEKSDAIKDIILTPPTKTAQLLAEVSRTSSEPEMTQVAA
ncbi:hypothetical protein DL546_000538 [Coniochaeta pulveracea]|uniref:Uncharacterized protein n=1 Tax=Coniochaeta pulveracea TaxID=177199 RepID=A0A420Y095_9PEZI|nr:hypothetical protein DL546_000538 [Coniochaeta pulveracea]